MAFSEVLSFYTGDKQEMHTVELSVRRFYHISHVRQLYTQRRKQRRGNADRRVVEERHNFYLCC